MAAPLLSVTLEGGCRVQVRLDAAGKRLPVWPSLAVGNQLEVEIFNAIAALREPQLWLILRSPDGQLLLSHYQNPGPLIEEGKVRDLLGLDVAITEPTCERFNASNPLLVHDHALRVQTGESSVSLDSREVARVPWSKGQQLMVQNGQIQYAFPHLLAEAGIGLPVDLRWGQHAWFTAWPEP